MPLDGISVKALCGELAPNLIDTKIEKIYQPNKEEVVLVLRKKGFNGKLLMNVSANSARIHFIDKNPENPTTPPMFCMLLRKHLQGAKITKVFQPDFERIINIEFDAINDFGDRVRKTIVCEVMSKHSNIILCDEEDRIIDAIRRVDGDISNKRQILSGLFYKLPPPQDKRSIFEVSTAGIIKAMENEDTVPLDKWILNTFFGFSPLLAREIAFRGSGYTDIMPCELNHEQKDGMYQVIDNFKEKLENNQLKPYILYKNGEIFDYTIMPVSHYSTLVTSEAMEDFSLALNVFYDKKDGNVRISRKAHDIRRHVTNLRDRSLRKLSLQEKELKETLEKDKYKNQGELIKNNLYSLSKGMTEAEVIDYYDENCPTIKITLDKRLSPLENSERYFKLYTKMKTREIFLTKQLEKTKIDYEYLNSVLESIAMAEVEADLSQIREELVGEGFMSKPSKKIKPSQSKPVHYITTDGFHVFAGKNNLQNDILTLKTAYKSDLWFHTQKIHGSHVIMVCDHEEPTDLAYTEAAMIAAYHSSARNSSMVPVDYTRVKNIKKPTAAKAGMVIYNTNYTAYVTVDEKVIEKLRVK